MGRIKNTYYHFVWILKGIKVFGLVGEAGTGKSFRSQLIAKKYGVDIIVDDGLLIRDQKILAGKSAKQENGAFTAVKTAIFDDPQHLQDVKKTLEKQDFKRVLILGTSNRMVHSIAKKLNLPAPSRTFKIEDIATKKEIEIARHSRHREGKHIIPVPAIEVKRKHGPILFNAVKIFFKRKVGILKKHEVFEKSIVRPVYSNRGRVNISEEALIQMVIHCVVEFDPSLKVKKVNISEKKNSYRIAISLEVPFKTQLSGSIHNLQIYILDNIEQYTGLTLDDVSITIDSIF